MDRIDTNEAVYELINSNEMVLIYFGSKSCNVCGAMKPKIKVILKNYIKIKSAEVDVEKALEVAAAFNVFTIPAILVFINKKETIREARYISIQEIDSRISRYYNMLF